ncbi:MAG: type VII secretion-associated serine protease mycosin [Micromonosporaceae bacterium]|nr:type VII secretion-associated serine protease mycosin [Micromonosporaceae bacterium]
MSMPSKRGCGGHVGGQTRPGSRRRVRRMWPATGPGLLRTAAAALLAAALGAGAGVLWQPPPAAAQETIRQLSWHLGAMHVKDAHEIATGVGVTVAVVDTGVDASHPDLEGQVLDGGEVGDAGAERQTKGQGDKDGHGTGMASLIAGKGDRGPNSVLGVAPAAKILPVKISQNSDGAFRPEDVYKGVRWAIDNGAKIVNISLGGERSVEAPWKKQLIDYAISQDVVLIAAAGNTGSGDKKVAEPASIPGVVAVSGLTRNGAFWDGSANGPEVVVSAPAKGLPHAVPTSVADSGYALADGTSGATALVSGVAALVRQAYPEATANDIVNRLIHTAEDRGDNGRDEEYGYGAVDALAALQGDVPGVKHHPLVSPEAAKSDEKAAARAAAKRSDRRVLVVVGVFIGSMLVLLVGAYLIYLARRSRQVVVAGVPPGYPAMVGVGWGQPGPQPMFPQYPPGPWYPQQPGQPYPQTGPPPTHPQPGPPSQYPQPGPPSQYSQPGSPYPQPGSQYPQPAGGFPAPAAPRPGVPQQPAGPGWPAQPALAGPGWPPVGSVSVPRHQPESPESGASGQGRSDAVGVQSQPSGGTNAVTQAVPIVRPAPAPPPPVDPWAGRPPQ